MSRTRARTRHRQAGLTLIEIMVSVALVGIATAFVFSIQMKMSSALRDQQTVSETQLTLRSATELMVRDVRMAGYLAQSVSVVGGFTYGPITVWNGGVDGAPDQLAVMYADTTAMAVVNSNTALLPIVANSAAPLGYTNGTGTYVSSVASLGPGMALFTHAGATSTSPQLGIGCILAITSVSALPNPIVYTNPAGGAPWNSPNNAHCAPAFATIYNDGATEVTRVTFRKYRIRPGDVRGILEMSPTGGIVNDYQPLAMGIVDMQVAVRWGIPATSAASAVAPCSPDGDNRHDWMSSDNMNGVPMVLPTDAHVVQLSVTLVAKTTKDVQGVTVAKTPDLFEGTKSCNHIGDVAGTALPVAATTSMYYGDHVYRSYTATVDLRNAAAQN